MWRAIASNALTLFIVVLIGFGIAIAVAQNMYNGGGPLQDSVCVSVPRGSNFKAVSEDLKAKGVVDQAILLRIGADYEGKSGDLKAGNFLIPPNASMSQVVQLLTESGRSTCGADINFRIGVASHQVQVRELDPATGEFEEIASFEPDGAVPQVVKQLLADGFPRMRVTVAEGVTSWQIADGLRKATFLSGEISSEPDEGTLAPGSYEVEQAASRDALLTRMREEQEAVLIAAWAGRADGLPLQNAKEALILASIIEKETAVAEERPQVSSVFVNRLNQGMRLQTDPTVIYGITEGEGLLGRGLRRSELARPTPWNTYVIPALPPTPIANPGHEAIEAAVNPAVTEYLFFVADGSGGHAFAATLAEHNDNVQRWRAIEKNRKTQN